MNRFRFRVWDKSDGGCIESMSLCNYGFLTMQNGADIEDDGFSVDDCIIEQCTGLKDKNGKLIYEGDVVIYESDKYFREPTRCLIFWDESYLQFRFQSVKGDYIDDLLYIDSIEIIGNIHENKELLNDNQ